MQKDIYNIEYLHLYLQEELSLFNAIKDLKLNLKIMNCQKISEIKDFGSHLNENIEVNDIESRLVLNIKHHGGKLSTEEINGSQPQAACLRGSPLRRILQSCELR